MDIAYDSVTSSNLDALYWKHLPDAVRSLAKDRVFQGKLCLTLCLKQVLNDIYFNIVTFCQPQSLYIYLTKYKKIYLDI